MFFNIKMFDYCCRFLLIFAFAVHISAVYVCKQIVEFCYKKVTEFGKVNALRLVEQVVSSKQSRHR